MVYEAKLFPNFRFSSEKYMQNFLKEMGCFFPISFVMYFSNESEKIGKRLASFITALAHGLRGG